MRGKRCSQTLRPHAALSYLVGSPPASQSREPPRSFADLLRPQDYVLRRSSSYDRTGGNADSRPLALGESLTLLDAPGPGIVTHLWATIFSTEALHLKKLVLRMYWDDEETPSVEAPLGDFFGLGLGEYVPVTNRSSSPWPPTGR